MSSQPKPGDTSIPKVAPGSPTQMCGRCNHSWPFHKNGTTECKAIACNCRGWQKPRAKRTQRTSTS